MVYSHILITGGAGFVGSSLALHIRKVFPAIAITCFDSLHRRGSELNIPRLRAEKIRFIHGDIRIKEDLEDLPLFDLMIECSAEPSVLAGITSSPEYLLNTNLVGTLRCLESVRKNMADLIFLSTSRVYPMESINNQIYHEEDTRFTPSDFSKFRGITKMGISELFPLDGIRSLYGATKLCSELFIQEYAAAFGISAIINRCGLISGPWQMGKVDQGVIMHWILSHLLKRPLQYLGYDGNGKQVRDVLHIADLCRLIEIQIKNPNIFKGRVFNAGGGLNASISLCELTTICQKVTGNIIPIGHILDDRPNDLIWYITDNTLLTQTCGWQPEYLVEQTVQDIAVWITSHRQDLVNILD